MRILVGLVAAAAAAGSAEAGDREDLLALEARWNRAVWEKDQAVLREILADDFVIIAANGATGGKADLIAAIGDKRSKVEPFDTRDVVVRVFGDAAVVTGRFTQTMTFDGRTTTTSYRYTDVYVRKEGAWRAVSAQATVAPPPPSAGA